MKSLKLLYLQLIFLILIFASSSIAQESTSAGISFRFEGNLRSDDKVLNGSDYAFSDGVEGQGLFLNGHTEYPGLSLDGMSLNHEKDFSVQFWVKTKSDLPTVFLSQKDFTNKSMDAQKNEGWVLYSSGGTFAFAVGSGERRLNYERDNGEFLPVNNDEWHQLTLTYSARLKEFRLYFDGLNRAIYKLEFDFASDMPITIGASRCNYDYKNMLAPGILKGKKQLQKFIDAFNHLEVENLKDDEFISLIVDPKELYISKLGLDSAEARRMSADKPVVLNDVYEARKELSSNAYTVFQNRNLTLIKPVSKIYSLQNGTIVIDETVAEKFTHNERLYPSIFSMDNLFIYDRVLNSKEVLDDYEMIKSFDMSETEDPVSSLTVAVWNIWHGGKHYELEKDGWDSRDRIIEMLGEVNADIILMQETYSSGDYIASGLGYYFATTSDWDYCHQGSNISVLSRFPILEVDVPPKAGFMNVCTKIAISKSQEIYALSNWYGMSYFPEVYNYQKDKFENTDTVPVLFGGDFNAVPHLDGGDSPASIQLIDAGFIDVYRSLFPDIEKYKGPTHLSGDRIDQLYYKGKGLKNRSTEVISDWPGGFPSDHYLIVSRFEID